jgi:hypothetical protein
MCIQQDYLGKNVGGLYQNISKQESGENLKKFMSKISEFVFLLQVLQELPVL